MPESLGECSSPPCFCELQLEVLCNQATPAIAAVPTIDNTLYMLSAMTLLLTQAALLRGPPSRLRCILWQLRTQGCTSIRLGLFFTLYRTPDLMILCQMSLHGTSSQPCWLAAACETNILFFLCLHRASRSTAKLTA